MTPFEEAFDLTGYGRFNYIVTFASGMVLLHVMIECVGVGYITNAAACELDLTAREIGLINSATFFGVIATAIFWGCLGDLYGRRRVMLPAIIASCVASFGSTMTINFTLFVILRFITGCLMKCLSRRVSASCATIFAYLGEMHSISRRDAAIMCASVYMASAFIVLPVLGWIIFSSSWSFEFLHLTVKPWRVYMWSWNIVGITAAITLLFLPESPRYLLVAKGREKAKEVLAQIYACNTRKKKEEYPVVTVVGVTQISTKHGFKVAFKNLALFVQFPLRRCVLISHICMFMIFMLVNGIYTWMPDILHEIYSHFEENVSMCDVMLAKYGNETIEFQTNYDVIDTNECETTIIHYMVYPTSVILGVLTAVMYIITGHVVAKHSKIKFLCTVLPICAIILAAAGLLRYPPVAVTLLTIGLCAGTNASLLAAISVQVFPTNIRALALCTLYMCGRLGAAVGANTLGIAVQMHCEIIFLTTTLGTAASVLLMLFWPNTVTVRRTMESRGFTY